MKREYDIEYAPEGMARLLHRLGFSYKKTKQVPGKADPARQRVFLAEYEEIKQSMDGTPAGNG